MITVSSRVDFLVHLVLMLPDKCKAVELGVLFGDFSEMILRIVKPDCLFLIDPYEVELSKTYGEEMNNLPVAYSTDSDYQNVLIRFATEINSAKVFVIRDYSYNVVRLLPCNELFDFVYIDSDHRYEAVKKDLNDWLPKLKENGIIALHDYVDAYGFGVIKAVDECIAEQGLEVILFNDAGGDIALKKKQA